MRLDDTPVWAYKYSSPLGEIAAMPNLQRNRDALVRVNKFSLLK